MSLALFVTWKKFIMALVSPIFWKVAIYIGFMVDAMRSEIAGVLLAVAIKSTPPEVQGSWRTALAR